MWLRSVKRLQMSLMMRMETANMIEKINQITQQQAISEIGNRSQQSTTSTEFSDIFEGKLKLSKHVTDRINRRSLDLSGDRIDRLNQAVDKAASKGAKESLVLLDDLAVLVSVQNRTVVTAIEQSNMKEGVFTHIDSAVIV